MSHSSEKVFVSYSWDSVEHQQWVLELVKRLREEGYDANFDRGITSTSTVNLNQMMVEHMRDDDYIIMVLTENYAIKADEFVGGVGFETILSLPIIQQNLDKLIILIRQPGFAKKSIPFHLQGINYFDFSNQEKFNECFEELIYRLQKVPMFDLGPVGEKKIRQPKNKQINTSSTVVKDFKVPRLVPPTDLEKNKFMDESFNFIVNGLDEILDMIKNENPNFYYQKQNISSIKTVYAFYLNGQNTNNLKIWLGNFFGSIKQIQFSVGRFVDINNDNSMNGSVNVEVDSAFNLSLGMPMNLFSNNKKNMRYDDVVKEIYENNIRPYLK